MNTSTTAITPSSKYTTSAFWERFWCLSGIQFVVLFIIANIIYGYQPQIGASADDLTGFYSGHRTWILLATAISGVNLLNLLWFTAALRKTLVDADQEGWGAAATAASAVFGVLFLLCTAIGAALAYSIAASRDNPLVSGLNDFAWALHVLSSFPTAMLIMSGVFGLWRAQMISNSLFTAGVAAVVLGVLGGTTWLSGGLWAPDGAYSRFAPAVLLVIWVLAVSRVLLTRNSQARPGW